MLTGEFALGGLAVTGRMDLWIRRTTIGCVAMLALSGQPGWVAALTPLSVDGMLIGGRSGEICGLGSIQPSEPKS